jgi:hypothetical protein
MEATIEIKDYEIDDYRIETRKTFFGGLKTQQVPLGKKKKYTIYLTIMPSEEERAIILKYKLDELSVEEEPYWTEEDIDRRMAMFDIGTSPMLDQMHDEEIREMRARKKQILLGQYFDNPFTKDFDIRQDAHTYADKLEKEILPLIKNQIDYYRLESVRRDKRTITL